MYKIDFPNDIMIEVTNNCNLNCATCYAHRDGRKKEFMSFKLFKKIINEIPNRNNKTISLYNYGEPLLHKDLPNFISYAKEKGIKHIKVATNGHFLTKDLSVKLVKNSLDYISISVDGTTQKSYESFRFGGNLNLVMKNIINLVHIRNKYGNLPIIEIQFIITSKNYKEINKIKILAKKLGVDILKFKTIEITENQWEYLNPGGKYSRYTNVKKVNYCNKPKESIVVSVDGTLLPCCFIRDRYIKSHNFGNVNNNTISELLEKNKIIINKISSNKSNIDYCKDCYEGNKKLYYKVIKLTG